MPNSAKRPLTLLIAALGGEGGGVLADWIIGAARSLDFPVQSTSIPGVAQRTGATTYYLELYPAPTGELDASRPVMTLAPAPGCVDVVLASELLEAGRAMLNGYVTPERTTLIASKHRVYTVAEKMQMGDGRFDASRIEQAAASLARRSLLFDMQTLASTSGSVINAVLFGALAGSGTLPLPRPVCEEAIRRSGKGAEASLKGFELGFAQASEAWSEAARGESPVAAAAGSGSLVERVRREFPASAHEVLLSGVARLEDFQDERYAGLYLDRLQPIVPSGEALVAETARFLALWMSYEDVIRVADLKSRASRFQRVRDEVRARPHEPVRIVDYFKPRLEEFAGLLPGALARPLLGWAQRRGLSDRLSVGLHVNVTGIGGFLMMRLLASFRPMRRRTSRYAEEQHLIERWLHAIHRAAASDAVLALEIALCGRLIKGYGDTRRRGNAHLVRILETLVEGTGIEPGSRAAAIRQAREAALADPEGRQLENTLAARGFEPRAPQAKPLKFFPRPTESRKAA